MELKSQAAARAHATSGRSEDRLADLARTLSPKAIEAKGTLLGMGSFGAVFDLAPLGAPGFVAKHGGDPRTKTGERAATLPADTFSESIHRQLVSHDVLRAEAGIPCVPGAILEADPAWMVMKKAEGLTAAELTKDERAQADTAAEAMCERIDAHIEKMQKTGATHGIEWTQGDINGGNASFVRTATGIAINEVYDPII